MLSELIIFYYILNLCALLFPLKLSCYIHCEICRKFHRIVYVLFVRRTLSQEKVHKYY